MPQISRFQCPKICPKFENGASRRKMGHPFKISQEIHVVGNLPNLPNLPQMGQICVGENHSKWGRENGASSEKMGQVGEISRNQKCPKLLKNLTQMGQKMSQIQEDAPFWEKWGKRGEIAPSWGDSGLGSEIQKGIPCCFLIGFHRFGLLFHLHCRTGSRIANSMVSQENLPNMPQISRFGSFFLPTWGKFWKWGKLKEMGHVGEIGEIQRKFQMSLKPILFLHKWGEFQGWGKMPHFRKTGFPEKNAPFGKDFWGSKSWHNGANKFGGGEEIWSHDAINIKSFFKDPGPFWSAA